MAIRISAVTQDVWTSSPGITAPPFTLLGWQMIVTDRNTFSTAFAFDNGGTTPTSPMISVQTAVDGTTMGVWIQPGELTVAPPSGGNQTLSAWYRTAVTVSGTLVTLYHGAASGALTTNTGNATSAITGLTTLSIGESAFGNEWINGRVANVKTWSAVLTQTEIEAEFGQYLPVRTANLLDWYPFLDGTSLVDYSGNGRTLTASGAGRATEVGPPIVWAGRTVTNPTSARARAANH